MIKSIEKNKHLTLKKAPAQINQSLKTGLEFLLRLAISDKPVVLSEIAKELDMDYTRVNRLFGTLAAMGFAERTSDRRYIAGPGIHVIATLGLHKSHLLSVAVPHLYSLAKRLNMRVALGVLWGRHVCYIFHGESNTPFTEAIDNRKLYEAEHSSIGLAMLAQMSDAEIIALYPDSNGDELNDIFEKVNIARANKYTYGGYQHDSLAIALGEPCIAGVAVAPEGKTYNEFMLVQELNQTAGKIYYELNKKKGVVNQ